MDEIITLLSNLSTSYRQQQNPATNISSIRNQFYNSICQKQTFAFRDPLISYIAENPSSSKVYRKMIKSCKYFFDKNPILVLSRFFSEYGTDSWGTWFDGNKIQLEKLESKIWINCEINLGNTIISPIYPFVNPNVCNDDKYFASTIIPKIYQSNIHKFILWNQTLSFDDFKFVASNSEHIVFVSVTVKYENDSVVPVEKLIEVLPKLEYMEYNLPTVPNVVSPNTLQELLKIPHFSNVSEFRMNSLSEAFDVDKFFDGIKKNKYTTFRFSFSYKISHQYKLRLQGIVKEIVKTKNHDYKIPLIEVPAMDDDDEELSDKLYEIFRQQQQQQK